MSTLTNLLRETLANELSFSIQVQSFHWNVRGMLFSQLHEFFGEIYEGAYGTIDALAEYIRIEGEMAPASLPAIYQHKTLNEINVVPGTAQEMLQNLKAMNLQVKATLEALMEESDAQKRYGLSDWVSAQIDMHAKWDWMISAHLE